MIGGFDAHHNLNGSRDLTTPLSWRFVIRGLALAMINLPANFEVSICAHYKDMKRDTRCGKCGGLGSYGSLNVTDNSAIRQSTFEFL